MALLRLLLTSDTGIPDGQSLVGDIRGDADEQLLLGVELSWVGQSRVTDLVESIRRVGDELTKEDFLE